MSSFPMTIQKNLKILKITIVSSCTNFCRICKGASRTFQSRTVLDSLP